MLLLYIPRRTEAKCFRTYGTLLSPRCLQGTRSRFQAPIPFGSTANVGFTDDRRDGGAAAAAAQRHLVEPPRPTARPAAGTDSRTARPAGKTHAVFSSTAALVLCRVASAAARLMTEFCVCKKTSERLSWGGVGAVFRSTPRAGDTNTC